HFWSAGHIQLACSGLVDNVTDRWRHLNTFVLASLAKVERNQKKTLSFCSDFAGVDVRIGEAKRVG
ncbi:hypothetical protein SERLADRAFT_390591, partial [Serpula lacrymans var. lacrymans S7.9]